MNRGDGIPLEFNENNRTWYGARNGNGSRIVLAMDGFISPDISNKTSRETANSSLFNISTDADFSDNLPLPHTLLFQSYYDHSWKDDDSPPDAYSVAYCAISQECIDSAVLSASSSYSITAQRVSEVRYAPSQFMTLGSPSVFYTFSQWFPEASGLIRHQSGLLMGSTFTENYL